MIAQGLAIGFVASIPLGPIGVICIQRTLNGNRTTGFISGMGAASADTIFAFLAVFALSYVQTFIDDKTYWIRAIGGIMVMLLGFSIFLKKVGRPSRSSAGKATHLSNYLSVLLLTLTNPSYIFVFLTLFAAMGVGSSNNSLSINLLLIIGVFVGASSWWFILTWSVNKLRKKFSLRSLWWINKITGGLIILLGVISILSIFVALPDIL